MLLACGMQAKFSLKFYFIVIFKIIKKEGSHKNKMAEKSIFIDFIGDTPAIRLLDFLITSKGFDYSLTDFATDADMSWSTLHRIFPKFLKNKIVVSTREVCRAKLYKLNQNNPLVKKLIGVYDTLLALELKKIAVKEKIAIPA